MSRLLLAITSIASALPAESDVFQGVFARIDSNNDGTVSYAEYAGVDSQTPFSALDPDANGSIDLTEFTTWVKVTQPRPIDRPPGRAASTAPPPPTRPLRSVPAPEQDGLSLPVLLVTGLVVAAGSFALGSLVGKRRRRRR